MTRHTPHLYLPAPWTGSELEVNSASRAHLEKVLRFENGSAVTYTDGAGTIGSGHYDRGRVRRGGEDRIAAPARRVTIAVAPPKSTARVRFVVEKLAELGVNRLLWLRTRYGEGRAPHPGKAAAWAQAALEQSRGAFLMAVAGPVGFGEAAGYGTLLVADPEGAEIGSVPEEELVLCIGPEGGFAPAELPAEAAMIKLGDNILRVETAAIVGAVLVAGAADR